MTLDRTWLEPLLQMTPFNLGVPLQERLLKAQQEELSHVTIDLTILAGENTTDRRKHLAKPLVENILYSLANPAIQLR